MGEPLRIRFVPGVMPGKWLRTWSERVPDDPLDAGPVDVAEQTAVLREGRADMCFVRLPIDREGLHLIPLYEEVPVVVVPRDHPAVAFDEVDVADLAGEQLLQDPVDVPGWRAAEEVAAGTEVGAVEEPAAAKDVAARTREPLPRLTVAQAVELVAAGTGIVILPMSLARLHHRKDVTHRPVTGVSGSRVGLAWRAADEDPRLETFIGIVRGRTPRSTRGHSTEPAESHQRGGEGQQSRSGSGGQPHARGGGRRRGGRPADRRGRRRRGGRG